MDYLKFLSVSKLYVELLRIIFGLNYLLIVNILLKKDISTVLPNYSVLDNFTKIAILFAICFFISRCFLLVSEFWLDFTCYIFVNRKRWEGIKEKWEMIRLGMNGQNLPIPSGTEMDLEIDEFIYKNDYLKSERERDYHNFQFSRLLLGAAFFLAPIVYFANGHGFFVLFVAAAIILFLTVKDYFANYEYNDFRSRVAKHIKTAQQ